MSALLKLELMSVVCARHHSEALESLTEVAYHQLGGLPSGYQNNSMHVL
jgi:hypothetical protein